jgi:hypothetical protein
MKNRCISLLMLLASLAVGLTTVRAATIEGGRINDMAADNFYFNIVAGPSTVRIDKFAVYAYHQESTKYYVYFHPGEFAGTENDAAAWTLVSKTQIKPTGWDAAFELGAGGTFIAAGQTGAFLICSDLANDNGALWGGADGELSNGDLTVSIGRWFTRLNETTPHHFVTSAEINSSDGFGGIITYEIVVDTHPARITNAPPASLTVTEGAQLRLEVGVEGTGPFTYQWRKGGQEIPGATSAVYTKIASLDDAGSYSVIIAGAAPPPATSGNTAVNVNPDTTVPTIASVSSDGALTTVTVKFSEPVDPVEAINTTHYSLSGGGTINSAELNDAGDTVILLTSRLNSFTDYTLQAGGIPDRAAARNPLAAGTSIKFTTPSYALVSLTTGKILPNWDNTYFNLTAGARDVTILNLAIVAFHDADTDYLLYTHLGEYSGTEFQPDAWTLVASNHVAANLTPTLRWLTGFKIVVPARQTQAFLVAHTLGTGTIYPGAGEIVTDDFTLSVGQNFIRYGDDIFDGGDMAEEAPFAGSLGYCFDACQPAVAPPELDITRDGADVILNWTAPGFTLQSSPTLNPANWTEVANTSPARVPIGASNKFFRLIKP